MTDSFDYIIVGAGLQGGLLCMALKHHQPGASVLLVDDGDCVGGNHTWSFHESDIPAGATDWLSPVVTSRWPDYSVKFPGFERRVSIPYASIDSHSFGDAVRRQFQTNRNALSSDSYAADLHPRFAPTGNTLLSDPRRAGSHVAVAPTAQLWLNTRVDSIEPHAIYAGDSKTVGRVVVDCRGPDRAELHSVGHCGYQSFHGFEIELSEPWPESNPIVMDACQDQAGGFRFTYSLPFRRHRVLVEDTRFSLTRDLDREDSFQHVADYVSGKTKSDWHVIREESGCLPMPWNHALLPTADTPLRGGYAGGWFHAATGYSLPLAVQWADTVARTSPHHIGHAIDRLAREHQIQGKQARFLNRLLFQLVRSDSRYEIFRRFYRVLSTDAIQRFYAHQFTSTDLARILIGRPPSRLTPRQFISSFVSER